MDGSAATAFKDPAHDVTAQHSPQSPNESCGVPSHAPESPLRRLSRPLLARAAREKHRRVTDVTYPDDSTEHFDYDTNGFNQVISHTLPSGAVQYYHYNGSNQLQREWNSVAGEGAATTYTYYGPGNHPEWTGLAATEQNARASSSGASYSALMKYNGRFQITEVHYPPTGSNSDPTVTYGYDANGNCTSITDELGYHIPGQPPDPAHTRFYTYDSYGRCISYTEPLNAPGWNGAGTVASRRWDWIYDRYIDGVGLFGASAHTAKEWHIQIEPGFNAAGERKMTARWFDLQNRGRSNWIAKAHREGESKGHGVSWIRCH